MADWQISLEVTGGSAESGHIFADFLAAAVDAESVSLHRDDADGAPWMIEVLTEDKPDQARIDAALAEATGLSGGAAGSITIARLEQKDWLAENRKSFPPLAIGPFWVYGSHIDSPVPAGKIGLCLDAGQAFGSGTHATTSGCMTMIERHLPREGDLRIADIGCGSGILAMAAAKWNPWAEIIAVDNDQKAVETTAENAARNAVDIAITAGVSDGYADALVQDHAPFDMILANILPGPLIAMAADAAAALDREGVLILSGLLESQQQQVLAAHEAVGLIAIDSTIVSGWAALVLCHRGEG